MLNSRSPSSTIGSMPSASAMAAAVLRARGSGET
jgi:hypothetical protein